MSKKGLDLLLLHPGTNRRVYEGLNDLDLPAIEPPFISALIAANVRNKNYSVDILDANAENLTAEETARRVLEYNPKLIATVVHGHQPSASSHLMGAIGETCKEIKGVTDTPIILSGIHPSSLPERTLREESIDFVARGEEHSTILGLLEGFESRNISNVPGLAYLDERNNFRMNKTASLAKDLSSELPDVAWDLLPMDKYMAHNWHAFFGSPDERKPYASLYTGLGCPFKCSFCCINAGFKASISEHDPKRQSGNDITEEGLLRTLDEARPTIRYWDPETVIKHIDYLVKNHGVKHLKFIDEMFVLNKRHVRGISDKIIERGYDLNIWAYARIDTVKDKQLLERMKEAGINWLALGIESANPDIRHGADKKFGNEDIFKYVRQVEEAGIEVVGNYMFGLRTDTPESMKQTMEMAKELNTAWFNIYPTMAYPGAPDYNWAKQKGIPLPGDPGMPGGWTAYSHHSYNTFPLATETLDAADILRARDDAFHEYFSPENTNYRNLVREKFGDRAIEYIDQMAQHRIPRRILGDKKPESVN